MEENRLTEEELAAKAAELEEREREIELKEKKLNTIDEKVVGMKESIYSHINVSVKTMDKVSKIVTIFFFIKAPPVHFDI